jgi:hypothetical protein
MVWRHGSPAFGRPDKCRTCDHYRDRSVTYPDEPGGTESRNDWAEPMYPAEIRLDFRIRPWTCQTAVVVDDPEEYGMFTPRSRNTISSVAAVSPSPPHPDPMDCGAAEKLSKMPVEARFVTFSRAATTSGNYGSIGCRLPFVGDFDCGDRKSRDSGEVSPIEIAFIPATFFLRTGISNSRRRAQACADGSNHHRASGCPLRSRVKERCPTLTVEVSGRVSRRSAFSNSPIARYVSAEKFRHNQMAFWLRTRSARSTISRINHSAPVGRPVQRATAAGDDCGRCAGGATM